MKPLQASFFECVAALLLMTGPLKANPVQNCEMRSVVLATEGTKFEPFKSFEPLIVKSGAISIEVGQKVKGFEVDLIESIFKRLPCYSALLVHLYDGVGEVTFTDAKTGDTVIKSKGTIDFAALFPGLNQNRKLPLDVNKPAYLWDMTFASTSIKQERREKFNIEFSIPYHKARKHFFGLVNISNFPDDLSGKKIAVKAGTNFETYVQFLNSHFMAKQIPTIEIVKFDDAGLPAFDKIFEALLAKEIDYTLADDELFESQQAKDARFVNFILAGPDLFNPKTFASEQFGEGVGFAFRKSDSVFIQDFNQALQSLIQDCGDHGYKSIYDKYFKTKSALLSHCYLNE